MRTLDARGLRQLVGGEYEDGHDARARLHPSKSVVIEPDERYEAWEVAGRFGVVCLPGGELAIWDDDPRTSFLSSDYDA